MPPRRRFRTVPSPDRPPHLGTTWGSSRETQGTEGGRRGPTVNNRRDVHVSTTGRRSSPTIGQQGDPDADLHEGPRSPASTPVMTRMRELSRRFSNHTLGGDAPLRGPTDPHREAHADGIRELGTEGQNQLIEGPGFPPGGPQQAR